MNDLTIGPVSLWLRWRDLRKEGFVIGLTLAGRRWVREWAVTLWSGKTRRVKE